MIRIVLADDHAQFRAYLKALLEQQPGLRVVGEAAHGEGVIDLLRGWGPGPPPHVVLMDVEMPGIGGVEATRALTALHPAVAVIALSLHHEPHVVAAMREAGARACLVKGDPLPELVQTITRVAASASGPVS
jgi:DNA-binding NarL/FixJ family response regulator